MRFLLSPIPIFGNLYIEIWIPLFKNEQDLKWSLATSREVQWKKLA